MQKTLKKLKKSSKKVLTKRFALWYYIQALKRAGVKARELVREGP